MPHAHRILKRLLDSLELELQIVVSQYRDAEVEPRSSGKGASVLMAGPE